MTNFLKSIKLLPNGFKKLYVPIIHQTDNVKSFALKSVLSEQNNFWKWELHIFRENCISKDLLYLITIKENESDTPTIL